MDEHGFHVEQYKLIRGEVNVIVNRIETLFRYNLLGTTAMYAWLITETFGKDEAGHCMELPGAVFKMASSIPPVFIVFSTLLVTIAHFLAKKMGTYLALCECVLGDHDLSWEANLQRAKKLMLPATLSVWILLLIAAIVASSTIWNSASDLSPCKAEAKRENQPPAISSAVNE